MIEKLNVYQSSVIIDDAQKRITERMKLMAELEPQVKEYYDAYCKLKSELDATKEKMEHDKELADWAVRMKEGIGKNKEFKVIRSESLNEMKPREKRKLTKSKREKKYDWTPVAVEKLRAIDRFVLADDLWEIMVEHYQLERNMERSKMRWAVINNCWLPNCKKTREGRLRGVLIDYKGHIGLAEWVTDDFKPKGKYSSQFIQSEAV